MKSIHCASILFGILLGTSGLAAPLRTTADHPKKISVVSNIDFSRYQADANGVININGCFIALVHCTNGPCENVNCKFKKGTELEVRFVEPRVNIGTTGDVFWYRIIFDEKAEMLPNNAFAGIFAFEWEFGTR